MSDNGERTSQLSCRVMLKLVLGSHPQRSTATMETALEKFRKLMEEWDIKPTDPKDQNLYVIHYLGCH